MPRTDQPARRAVVRSVMSGLRDGWLIIGITLALFTFLEVAYRAQSRIRGVSGGQSQEAVAGVTHPHAGQPWFRFRRPETGDRRRFDPYRSWWPNALASRYVNVDSAGRRVTPQSHAGAPGLRIFTLGGSTMWGITHIDSLTIPAMLARELEHAELPSVEVLNYAQSTFTLTQNLITLMLELRRGNVPDAVVFLDGLNDIATAWASGRAGMITNEALAAQAFERGRRGFHGELLGLARHSALIRRVRIALGGPQWALPAAPSPEICAEIGAYYRNLVRQGVAIGEAFGIAVIFYFQPILGTSRKLLTPFEESVRGPPAFDELVRQCAAESDRQLADAVGRYYVPLHALFDADTASVYTDAWGHLTVYGNERVARTMAEKLVPILRSRTAAPVEPAGRRF